MNPHDEHEHLEAVARHNQAMAEKRLALYAALPTSDWPQQQAIELRQKAQARAIEQAKAHLRAGRYAEATKALEGV